MKSCPFCAEEIQDAAVVCKHCGRDIQSGASKIQIVEPKKKTGCVAAGCAVMLGLFILSTMPGFCRGSSSVQQPSSPGGGVVAPQPTQRLTGNPGHNLLMGKTEAERGTALAALVKGAGEPCSRVVRTFYQGMSKERQAFWNVQCSNGSSYSLMINPDRNASGKVVSCTAMKAIAGTECFTKF